MTRERGWLAAHLNALRHLQSTEQQMGIEPVRRQDQCEQPSDMVAVVIGEASPEVVDRVEKHKPQCVYCELLLQSIKAFLSNERIFEKRDEDWEDPLAKWIRSGEPVKQKTPPATPPVEVTQRL